LATIVEELRMSGGVRSIGQAIESIPMNIDIGEDTVSGNNRRRRSKRKKEEEKSESV
jgi:hypothetical protein